MSQETNSQQTPSEQSEELQKMEQELHGLIEGINGKPMSFDEATKEWEKIWKLLDEMEEKEQAAFAKRRRELREKYREQYLAMRDKR